MADGEHLGILKQGVAAWNKWRASNPEIRPNLTGADLVFANLTDAYFLDTNLRFANLTRTNLAGANLTGARLTGANLTDANLTGADLTGAGNLTQKQLDSACIIEGARPPTLPEGLKPPQNLCMPEIF